MRAAAPPLTSRRRCGSVRSMAGNVTDTGNGYDAAPATGSVPRDRGTGDTVVLREAVYIEMRMHGE